MKKLGSAAIACISLLLLHSAPQRANSISGEPCAWSVLLTGPTTLQNNTARIQDALDAASKTGSQHRRGCVEIGDGDWPVGGVVVRSNTTVTIAPGARLVSKINVTRVAVLQVDKAEHVTLAGGGGIHGHAEEAWSYFSDKDARMAPVAVDGSMSRPHTLLITYSRDVHVHHLFIHNSTDWTFRMDSSDDIYVDSVDIYGDERFPNNDGFDPEGCTNVTLVNSHINVADDAVCPKTNERPLRGLVVRNTTLRSRSGAIKFGSNTGPGTMSDIVFDNLTIWSSNGGMKIQGRGGGSVPADISNVTWSNIVIETQYHAPRWWGNGEWLGVSLLPRNPGDSVGTARNIRFVNISGRSENGGLLSSLQEGGLQDVLFENIYIKIATWSNYSVPSAGGGRGPVGPGWPQGVMCEQDPQICGSDDQTCTQSGASAGAQLPCWGSHDYRPHNGGNCSYYCRTPSQAHGIYAENVHGLILRNVTIEFEQPRRPWFGECVKVDSRSTRVLGLESVHCLGGPGKVPPNS
eukprot:SAG31_NODE_653_length_13152_cov_4.899487_3_plen_519_part_00